MSKHAIVVGKTVAKLTQQMYPSINQSILDAINDFMAIKAISFSKSTLYGYVLFLTNFFLDINVNSLSEMNSELLVKWLDTYRVGKANGTIANKISKLSCFFEFCIDKNLIFKNPVLSKFRCKVHQNTVRSLSETEYQNVRKTAEELSLFSRTIFEVLDSSGIRCSELTNLKLEGINFENRNAIVVGKGNKVRVVPLSEIAILLLKKLTVKKEKNDYVFKKRGDKKIHRDTVLSEINLLGKRAKLTLSLFPHRLRHGFASRLYSEGMNLDELRKQMGHAHEETTLGYIDVLPLQIKYFYDKVICKND